MNWLIDDGHLGRYLRDGKLPKPIRRGDQVFTSGYWYVRLCQALVGSVGRGALSGPFELLEPVHYRRVMEAVVALPREIGLLSLRELGPTIGRLRQAYELNILSSEALAAASTLQASVLLSVVSPRLEMALASEGLRAVVSE